VSALMPDNGLPTTVTAGKTRLARLRIMAERIAKTLSDNLVDLRILRRSGVDKDVGGTQNGRRERSYL
jgi:hypothetical protein